MEDSYNNTNINHGLRWNNGQTSTRRGFFQHISEEYGCQTMRIFKSWTTFRHELSKSNAKQSFLTKCRREDVVPTHISNSMSREFCFNSISSQRSFTNCSKSFSKRILKLEIQDLFNHIAHIKNRLNALSILLGKLHIDQNVITKFRYHTETKTLKIYNNFKVKLDKKLFRLLSRKTNNNNSCNNSDWLINLTKESIPQDVVDVVSLGRNFNLKTKFTKQNIFTTVKNLEHNLNMKDFTYNKEVREIIVDNIIKHNNNNSTSSKQDIALSKKVKITKNYLKEHRNLFFTCADKGNVTVCMNTDEYIGKMENIFSDTTTYTKVKKNPLISLQKSVYQLLSFLNDNDYLPKKYHKNSLTQTNTVLAKAYGLPKIHKDGAPLRPIISSINSPVHLLAKILNSDLSSKLKKPVSHVDNSFLLKDKLSNINIPTNYILLSLDVTSLFTNVPCQLVIDSLDKRFSQINNRSKIPYVHIIELVKFLFDNTYFQFNDKIYKQVFGSPMGSPISPIFADLVMEDLEVQCLKQLQDEFNHVPLFYFRYVDDTIMCINKEFLQPTLDIFNSYNPHLQFTHEIEVNNSINFLDLTLIKDNNKIITNWYQKKTSSGRILNFNSNHTTQQKRNIVSNLIDRALLLSHVSFHQQNIDKVKHILSNNNYPMEFIDSCISSRIRYHKFKNTTIDKTTTNSIKPTLTLSLPYIEKFYYSTAKRLKKYDVRCVPLMTQKIDNIIRLGKDQNCKWKETGIIYKFNCGSCSSVYIGESKRSLETRIREHKKSIEKIDHSLDINSNKLMPVPTHIFENPNHFFDWENTVILDREHSFNKRRISEMLHIKSNRHTINRHEDTKFLNSQYNRLINLCKT